MTISSLSAITSNYGHLNGVEGAYYGLYDGGYFGYGLGGVYSTANAEQAKERIANNYDVFATHQGLRSKQGVESINYNEQCLLIADSLKKGETDQVANDFEDIVKDMKNSPQYANYSYTEICSLIRKQYNTATGTDLVSDINKYASSSWLQGIKRSIPIFGVTANKNSKADLIALVTNNDKPRSEKTAKTLGYMTGAAVGGSAIAGLGYAAHKAKVPTFVSKLIKDLPVGGKITAGVIAGITGISFLASLFNNNHVHKSTK